MKTITVKNYPIDHVNGNYQISDGNNIGKYIFDKDSDFFIKDNQHHIYRHKGKWRIANNGKQIYYNLTFCSFQNIDTNVIDYNVAYRKKINLGILNYSNISRKWASSNIGDWVQSLAAINIYKKII